MHNCLALLWMNVYIKIISEFEEEKLVHRRYFTSSVATHFNKLSQSGVN